MHTKASKITAKNGLRQEMISADLDPDDTNVTGRSGELIEKVPSISKIANAITSKGGIVAITDTTLGTAAGSTDIYNYKISMNLNDEK